MNKYNRYVICIDEERCGPNGMRRVLTVTAVQTRYIPAEPCITIEQKTTGNHAYCYLLVCKRPITGEISRCEINPTVVRVFHVIVQRREGGSN